MSAEVDGTGTVRRVRMVGPTALTAVPVEANRRRYDRASTVAEYVRQDHLNPAEQAFIDRSGEELASWSLLDIGIGGGRTTARFAPLVENYVGIDYAAGMVEASRQRLRGNPEIASSLFQGDARRLEQFSDASFDAVLFVGQGLDALDHQGRLQAIKEMARVCRPRGWLYISTHNLASVDRALSLRQKVDDLRGERSHLRLPLALAKRIPERLFEKLANPSPRVLATRDHAFLVESWPWPRLTRMYYSQPAEALRQLDWAGFTPVTVVGADGRDLGLLDGLTQARDLWLHYLGRKRG